jgi:hypothetical protein
MLQTGTSGVNALLSGTCPTKQRRTRQEIASLEEALLEICRDNEPLTIRHAFYLAVAAALIAKDERDYKNVVCRLLLRLRRRGRLPYSWIVDSTRWMRKPTSYVSLVDAMQRLARSYRQDLWCDQPVYVEVWVEKEAMAGVLMEETVPWDIPLMVSKGFSSESFLYSAAEKIKDVGKPTYIYYFGDFDPSGIYIDRDIERRLRGFCPNAEIHFVRLGVTAQHIREYSLPTRPPKRKKNTHAQGFRGERCVEIDAVPPRIVRDILRTAIEQHIDRRRLEVTRAAEASEREVALALAKTLFYERRETRPRREDE